jgi:hypothetical protein
MIIRVTYTNYNLDKGKEMSTKYEAPHCAISSILLLFHSSLALQHLVEKLLACYEVSHVDVSINT